MANITEKAMLVRVKISQWTARKYDRKATAEVEANHSTTNAGRFNKILVAKETIDRITKISNRIRVFVYENTLPWQDEGSRILPAANFMEFSQGLRELKNEWIAEVDEFCSNYAQYREESRIRLNGLFNEQDYPDASRIREKFDFATAFYPVPSASDFRVALQEGEVSEIREQIENSVKNATDEAMKDLWNRLHTVVSHMSERLDDADKKFHDTLVSNISDLCNMLGRLNITGDANLEAMRKKIESKLTVVEPDSLREDKVVRAAVASDADAILAEMAKFM